MRNNEIRNDTILPFAQQGWDDVTMVNLSPFESIAWLAGARMKDRGCKRPTAVFLVWNVHGHNIFRLEHDGGSFHISYDKDGGWLAERTEDGKRDEDKSDHHKQVRIFIGAEPKTHPISGSPVSPTIDRPNGYSIPHLSFCSPQDKDPAALADMIDHYAGRIEDGIKAIRSWTRAMALGADALGVEIEQEPIVQVFPDNLHDFIVKPMRRRALAIRRQMDIDNDYPDELQ